MSSHSISTGVRCTAADQIAAECHKARSAQALTMSDLAARAGVSVRMLVRMENSKALAETIRLAHERSRRDGNKRQAIALARILTQVAIALGKEPIGLWVNKCRLPLNELELHKIEQRAVNRQRSAVTRQRHSADSSSNLQEEALQRHYQEEKLSRARSDDIRRITPRPGRPRSKIAKLPPANITIDAVLIPYVPFGPAELIHGTSFLERFATCSIRSIDYYLNTVYRIAPDFRSVLSGENGAIEDQPKMVLGFLQQVQREFAFPKWRFESIPGFRIRLAFLAPKHASGSLRTWRDLLPDRPRAGEFHIMVVKDSVAEAFLRGVCRIEPREISHENDWTLDLIRSDYAPKKISKDVRSFFLEHKANSLFVSDQCTAETIVKHIKDLDLIDLASEDELDAPSYPLGIATPADDTFLRGFVSRAIHQELFVADCAVTANIYARFLAETAAITPVVNQTLKAFLAGKVPTLRVPSYLKLVADPRWTLPAQFIEAVRHQLRDELTLKFQTKSDFLNAAVEAFFEARLLI